MANSEGSKLSFFKANSPVFFASKIFGQVPFSFVKIKENEISSKFTFPNIAYCLVCFGAYVTLCYLLVFSYGKVFDIFPSITVIGHYLHLVIGFVTASFSFVLSFTKSKKLCSFINELQQIDAALYELCDSVQINYRKTFNFHLKLIFVTFILFCIVGGFDYYVFQWVYGGLSLIIIVSCIVPFLFSCCVYGQFIVGVHLIHQRFIMINRFLNIIADTNEPTSEAVKMHRALFQNIDKAKGKSEQEPFSISRNLVLRRNDQDIRSSENFSVTNSNPKMAFEEDRQSFFQNFKSFLKCGQKTEEQSELNPPLNLHLRMNEIFSIHDRVSDIAEVLNELYSAEMVIFTTGCFIMTVFGVFFETKVIFWAKGFSVPLLLFATSYVMWGVLLSVITYTILRACSNAREESCESALIIHKILQNKPAFMINDEAFHSKMKSFTLQILHRKKVFYFHGLGLFKLDYTFIFSAVSAATSYLIVLLQFDMSSDFQKFIVHTYMMMKGSAKTTTPREITA